MRSTEKPKYIHDLVCPLCKTSLKSNSKESLKCGRCKTGYPITDNIPVLLTRRQIKLSESDRKYADIPVMDHNEVEHISAEDWDSVSWEIHDDRAERRMRKVLKFIPKNGIHLDIGTGRGDGTALVKTIKSTIGLDYGLKSAKIATKQGIFVVQANSADLPFPDNYFSSITCLDVLEHVLEPQKTLEEVYRVLKKDGTFILQTPSREAQKIKDVGRYLFNLQSAILHPVKAIKFILRKTNLLQKMKEETIPEQPIEIFRPYNTLLNMIKKANFVIANSRKIRYWNQHRIIWLFSLSELFILKKK